MHSDNNMGRKSIRSILSNLVKTPNSPFAETYAAPPDIFGHLADRSVLRSDIIAIGKYVRSQWPKVQRIDCGIDCFGLPHLDVQLDPFEWADMANHRPLADWIRTTYPATEGISIHFFPMLDPDRIRSSITVYERNPQRTIAPA
jgi:hypothetical protein